MQKWKEENEKPLSEHGIHKFSGLSLQSIKNSEINAGLVMGEYGGCENSDWYS